MELAGPLLAASSAMTLTSFSPPSLDEDHARFVTNVATGLLPANDTGP
jgi:hypothetical protein